MTSSNLFKSKGLVELANYLTPDTLFAFDLDGTLAPIVDDFAEATVPQLIQETLQRLVQVAKVSVITGRCRRDALNMLGMEPQLVVGNHGAEWPTEICERNYVQVMECLKWREALFDSLCYTNGVEIEYKGETLSVHYRKAEEPDKALAKIEAAIERLEPRPRCLGGKFVVNLLPPECLTKGEALAAAMAELGTKRAVYFGDDRTDEEVFRLQGIDLFGIRIGGDEETAARYHLEHQREMLGLLHSMVGIMEALYVYEGDWEQR